MVVFSLYLSRVSHILNHEFACSRFLYPGIVALIVSSLSYPLGTGQFIAGQLSTHEQVLQLFTNFTWTADELTVEQATIVNNWRTYFTDIFFHLSAYLLFTVNIITPHDLFIIIWRKYFRFFFQRR